MMRSLLLRGYVVTAACAAWGCGGGGTSGSDASGGSGATGGMAQGGTAAVGAGSGAGGSAVVSSVKATCDAKQAKFSYDDAPETSYALRGWPMPSGNGDGLATRLYDPLGDGLYWIVYEQPLTSGRFPQTIPDTQAWPVRSALLAEATEQTLGSLRCVAPGSGSTLVRQGDQLLLDFKQVDVIEACGDSPLEGQINLCFKFGGCDDFDGGTLGATPWVLQPDGWVGGGGTWKVDFSDGTYLRAQVTNLTQGPAYWALIVTSPSGPYSGAVYCASGGSVEQLGADSIGGGYPVMHFTGLGELKCAAGSGTAQGCIKGG
jgi:hypothetical protein